MQKISLNPTQIMLIALGFCVLCITPAYATYEHGNGALQIWDAEGQANAPAWVQVWLGIMAVSMLSGFLFIWKYVEARWVVGCVFVGILVTRFLVPALPVVKFSGLIALLHLVFWSPALFILLKNKPFTKGLSFYAVWSGLITSVILFSFIFDIRDAAIYLHYLATR